MNLAFPVMEWETIGMVSNGPKVIVHTVKVVG